MTPSIEWHEPMRLHPSLRVKKTNCGGIDVHRELAEQECDFLSFSKPKSTYTDFKCETSVSHAEIVRVNGSLGSSNSDLARIGVAFKNPC